MLPHFLDSSVPIVLRLSLYLFQYHLAVPDHVSVSFLSHAHFRVSLEFIFAFPINATFIVPEHLLRAFVFPVPFGVLHHLVLACEFISTFSITVAFQIVCILPQEVSLKS